MAAVPKLDVDEVDNCVYNELDNLRLKIVELYDIRIELWTGVEEVDIHSNKEIFDEFLLSFSPNVSVVPSIILHGDDDIGNEFTNWNDKTFKV